MGITEHELEAQLDQRFGGVSSDEVAPEVEEPEGSPEEGGSPAQPRDEQGRFVAPPEEPAAEEQDPLVADFLARHGGDVDTALKTAAHQMSLMGQQAQELGELRKAVEGLKQDFETEEYPVDEHLMTWAENAALENPVEAALWSLQHQPAVYDTIMQQWYAQDPMGASRFERSLEMQAVRQQVHQEIGPIMQPAQEAHQRETFMRAWTSVQGEFPDLPQYAPAILEAAKGAPEIMQALASGDADAKTRVLRTLFFVARGQNLEALHQGAQVQSTEAAEQLRRQAAVGSMTNSAPPSPAGEGTTGRLQEFRADFRQTLMEEGLIPRDSG